MSENDDKKDKVVRVRTGQGIATLGIWVAITLICIYSPDVNPADVVPYGVGGTLIVWFFG